jgi:hypothetical protein
VPQAVSVSTGQRIVHRTSCGTDILVSVAQASIVPEAIVLLFDRSTLPLITASFSVGQIISVYSQIMAAGACAYSHIIPVEIGDVIKPVVYPNPADNSIGPKISENAPISLCFGGGKAMVSSLFYYQLALFVLVWLFVMLHVTWSKPSLPTPPVPAKSKRPRSNAPKAFEGVTKKPHCPLGERGTVPLTPPSPVPPEPMPPTNRRPRTVDTSMPFCPPTDYDYRGWLGLNNL